MFTLALSALGCVSWFHLLNLATCYLTAWIRLQSSPLLSLSGFRRRRSKACLDNNDNDDDESHGDNVNFALGRGRLEVAAVLASAALLQLAALLVIKEAGARMMLDETPQIQT